ncbi:MAG: right-handed parallel beta-helix repeat-containing protein [Candidatus Bathyarchaeota archaeon]|nr:right-handed parallel beta-helix repeat-containing protein [Candidatus Bathyarchaeota archaeon]
MKKNASTLVLVLVLTAVCYSSQFDLAFANYFPAPPTVDVYIRADGSVMPSYVPIQKDGNVYVFTGDLVRHVLFVECDNVVVDGAGFALKNAYVLNDLRVTGQKNVTIKNLNMSGVYVNSSSNVTISNCAFRTVMLRSSCYNQIVGNTISMGTDFAGVDVASGSLHNVVVRNTITCPTGVKTIDSNYTTVSENNFTNCVTSIALHDCHNLVSKNSIENGVSGGGSITITQVGSYNIVFGNNITGRSQSGIKLVKGCHNVFYENLVTNFPIGISFGSSGSSQTVADNRFYNNNFVNNTQNLHMVYNASSNVFDNSFQGNYWSSYNGIDTNGNCIGDTPYVMHANFTDPYPLMYPFVLGSDITASVVVVSPENCTYTTNEVTLTFSSNKTLTWTAYRLDTKNMKEFDVQKTLSGLSDGVHNITVYAKDTAGNMLSSKTVSFQIDANQNVPLYAAAVVVAVAACVLVGVFISLRKTKPEM